MPLAKIASTLYAVVLCAMLDSAHAQATVAGFTPGSFRVTESGAAEYRIPIRVPPGIAGMEPKLALVYNSQGGNGLLGVGWNLEGLSSITRCPRTIAQDGMRGGVNYDWNDRYCLDGQRLMAISGSYGADGTEYRTERESFTKVVSYGVAGNGPAWFKAWTKSGQIIEYGNSADSRIEAQGKSTVRTWAVSKVSDTKGNYLTATYTEDAANGDFRPHQVTYSGSPAASVRFFYAARTDVERFYEAGSAVNLTHRLTNVQTYVGASMVSDLRLAYDYGWATGRSRMSSLSLCEPSACLLATTFVRQESGSTFTYAGETAIGIGWSSEREWIPMDVNGDGRTDMVIRLENGDLLTFLSNGTGFSPPVTTATGISATSDRHWFPMDVNGDGRSDLVVRFGDGDFYTFLSNGSGFSSPGYTAVGIGWSAERQWLPMDVNGDGRTDMVVRMEDGGLNIFLSNGAGFSSPPLGTVTGIGSASDRHWFAMDVNGDGRSDLVVRFAVGDFYTFLSNGSGFASPLYNAVGLGWSANRQWLPMDVNGDGRTDMVVRLENGELYTFLSNGAGFSAPTLTVTGISSENDRHWFAMDVNGDGRSDLVVRYVNGDFYTFVSNGAGFSSPAYTPLAIGWASNRQWFPMDVNGDGRSDMLIRLENGHLHTLRGPPTAPDLVTSITNGLGATVAMGYQPITNGWIHTKDSGADAASYPIVDLQPPSQVVESHTLSGAGAAQTVSYSYGGLKASSEGRGLLGFRWLEAVEQSTGLKTRTEHRQDWPYLGMPSLVKRTQSSGAVLSQATSTHSCTNPATGGACTVAAGDRYFPFVSQSVETGNDLNGATLPTVTTTTQYDGLGNAISVTVGTGDGHSKTTSNVYANDVPNWLLGRLTRSTVQSTSP